MGIESKETVKYVVDGLIKDAFNEFWEFLSDVPKEREKLLSLIFDGESKEFYTCLAELKALNNNPKEHPEHAYIDALIHDIEVLHNFILGDQNFIQELNILNLCSTADLGTLSAEIKEYTRPYLLSLQETAKTEEETEEEAMVNTPLKKPGR